jgi:hypothetical protein
MGGGWEGDGTGTGRGRDGEGTGTRASSAAALVASGIDGGRRPETLSIAEFARLADAYSADSR